MSIKMLIAAVAALSFAATGAADAKSKHKHYRAHYGPYAYVPAPSYGWQTPRPPWAAPWECYTDEGYGRYRPCSAGRR
jgi:hypothetical protein